MIRLDCDYMRGCHPEVLQKLVDTNMEQHAGYGLDIYSREAEKAILKACGLTDGDVSILVGGTQTNVVVLDALLAKWQGVLCAESAHINVHESGAIEATGHKVMTLPSADGKINAEQVARYVDDFYKDETWQHMVEPGAVYITHPTETGTLYTRAELQELSKVCRRRNIPLYLDGARLLYGLASPQSDVTLADIAELTDAFYIGGTKAGTLFGEAVVVPRKERLSHFFTQIKRHGALLAKGRVAGVQFLALFEGDLWKRIGCSAVATALRLRAGLEKKGYSTFVDSPTNQQFFILPNSVMDSLAGKATFEIWGVRGESETPVRFVTDWATTPDDIDTFLSYFPQL